jgi:hypothetical protein
MAIEQMARKSNLAYVMEYPGDIGCAGVKFELYRSFRRKGCDTEGVFLYSVVAHRGNCQVKINNVLQ